MEHRSAWKRRLALLAFVLAFVPIAASGCTKYPADPYGEIPMDEWCDEDGSMPWTGCWEEVAQIDCESGEEFEAEETIGELRLRAGGGYSVTRYPFEHFVDYAGTYTLTETGGAIEFSAIDTPTFNGEGEFLIKENGDLVLDGVWFGVYEVGADAAAPVACGYVFR